MIEPKDLIAGKVYCYIRDGGYSATWLADTTDHSKRNDSLRLAPDVPFVVLGEKQNCWFRILHLENGGIWDVQFNPEKDKFQEILYE